jgi:MFS transporter, FSR family, fosmidomycin resistance protein
LNLLVALVLGVVHLVVDGASGVVLARSLPEMDAESVVGLYLLYNGAAFALQPLAGLVADHDGRHGRAALLAGLLLASLALPLTQASVPLWVPILASGLGNALFHVGGGVWVWRATAPRAAGLGLYIGPGALGVLAGRILGGRSGFPAAGAALGLLAASVLVVLTLKTPRPAAPSAKAASATSAVAVPPSRPGEGPSSFGAGLRALLVALLLLAILIRSLAGFAAGGWFGGDATRAVILALVATTSKAAGGFLADRLGWLRFSVAVLLLSAALFAIPGHPVGPGLLGLALFQTVTSVTLAALFLLFPSSPGLAFGLSCLALFVGALPVLTKSQLPFLATTPVVVALCVLSAFVVASALKWLLDIR